MNSVRVFGALVLLLGLVGCNSKGSSRPDGLVGDGKAGDGKVGDGPSPIDGRVADAAITDSAITDGDGVTTIKGTVRDANDLLVSGATVSIEGTTTSTTTATNGTYTISVKEGLTVFLRFTKTGLVGALRGIVVPQGGEVDFDAALIAPAEVGAWVTQATLPARKTTDGLVSVEFEVLTAGGQKAIIGQANAGSFVLNSAGTAVKGDTVLSGGDAVVNFVNVAVGNTTATPSGGTNCALVEAITSYPVVANLRTIIVASCQ